ncbi:hypothetical protein R1sor_024841 [Riccia sorocarpa]|uniref:MULE transposase domain-containing protein n=1 Tax=Riccia sorocarpa TaxID=122646 RepID=A0ABD3GRK8_9MARC
MSGASTPSHPGGVATAVLQRTYDDVQIPANGTFDSSVLKWTRCKRKGNRGSASEEAWIPFNRFEDFLRGEQSRPNFQCRFKVIHTETNKNKGLITRRYWCSYGPKDERKETLQNWASLQLSVKQKNLKGKGPGSRPAARTVDTGYSVRRGCRARVPPIEILLEVQDHIAQSMRTSEDGTGGRWTRDMQLTSRDIRNIQARMRREGQLYHQDDAQALWQWVERNPTSVLLYQEQSRKEDKLFFLVVSTPWMLRKLAKYGHQNAICMDATHGTNRYGFQLFTWLVYDTHQNGLPAVWALVERHRAEELTLIQSVIKQKVEGTCAELLNGDAELSPTCFICDDSLEEKASINNVYPTVPIDLCIWHVRSAFNKNLQGKVQHPVHRALMNRDLDPKEISEAFIRKWASLEPAFIKYYTETWVRKLEQWVVGYRNHRRANQNTTVAVERWHSTLKAHIRSSRMTKTLRKLSWLIVMAFSLKSFKVRLLLGVITLCQTGGRMKAIAHAKWQPWGIYVKALFIDGFTETQVVKGMGRMWGSNAGGMTNLVEPEVTTSAEVSGGVVTDEHEFHFLFTGPSNEVIPEDEPPVTLQSLLEEVMKLAEKVDNDPTLLNHALLGIKKVTTDCLDIQARMQTNTGLWESQDRVLPTPFQLPEHGTIGTELSRKKPWHEQMMDSYQRKGKTVMTSSLKEQEQFSGVIWRRSYLMRRRGA